MRSTWKGTISCGLLNVPAKLYAATEEKSIRFNSIHKECGSRIEMPKWCPVCNRKVDANELVKGYPLDKDKFVTLDDAELESVKLPTISSIEVLEFIQYQDDVLDPRLPNKSYFLSPDKGGQKGFALLSQTMAGKGVAAVVKVAMRQKEHLGIVRPFQQGVLLLQTLYWDDELRPWGELVSDTVVSDAELKLAGTLIDTMHGDGILKKYSDKYREALEEAIEAKLNGQVLAAPEAPKPSEEGDLASLLEASIAQLHSTMSGGGA